MKANFGNLIKITGVFLSSVVHPAVLCWNYFHLCVKGSICTVLLPTASLCHLIKAGKACPGQAYCSQTEAH